MTLQSLMQVPYVLSARIHALSRSTSDWLHNVSKAFGIAGVFVCSAIFCFFTHHLFCLAEFWPERSASISPRMECIHLLLGDAVQGPPFGHQRNFDWTPDAADVTSPRINWFLPSPHQISSAPMPGLMVSLEFRLHPVAFAVRVIGHRRHVWFLSMEREPEPMSRHRS